MSEIIPAKAYATLAPELKSWIASLGWKREELAYINISYNTAADTGKIAEVSVSRAGVVEQQQFVVAKGDKHWRTEI